MLTNADSFRSNEGMVVGFFFEMLKKMCPK